LTTDELPDGTYWEFTSPTDEPLYIQRHKREYYRKVGDDQWKKGLEGISQVLYNLPVLMDGVRGGEIIYHLEGPKDVETAREKLGVVATTSGSTSSWKTEFKSFYTGADVVIVPDNDEPGRRYAEKVAQDLLQVARRVRVVLLPDLGEGEDLTDWLEAGHTKEEFLAAVETAAARGPEEEEPWPEPRDLDTSLPPVADLKKSMLPEPLRTWIFDTAERMERVPPDFVAVDAIVAAGALIGRKVGIRPKRYDDWDVIPNVWGATVGRPSTMKSPAQKAALKPIARLGAKAFEDWQGDLEEWEVAQKIAAADEKALRGALEAAAKTAAKKGDGNRTEVDEAAQRLRDMERSPKPSHKRYDTNDSTIEKLTELLGVNPNGLLLHRDELMGWLKTLDKPGHESDRAFFLEAWSGDQSYKADRIERGFIYAPAVCLSVLGGIQPGPLERYVRDALEEAEKADGLLQRFQMVVWPDLKPYRRVDQPPNIEAIAAANLVFEKLDTFDPEEFGATPGKDGEVPFVRFSPEAQEVFDSWRDELEPRYLSGDYPAALEAHFAKYRSLFASLALIFEVIAHIGDESEGWAVGETSAHRAAAWCEYLESHAHRLYHPALMAPVLAADALLEKIQDGAIAHRTKLRLIVDKGWEGLSTTEKVREAVSVLEAHGWVRLVKIKPPTGRPSEELFVHPDLRGGS
jgi:Protein of unknown function (DUF3987)